MADAPKSLGATDGSEIYLIVEGVDSGGLELAVHSAEAGTGYMQVNPDGTINQVYPP